MHSSRGYQSPDLGNFSAMTTNQSIERALRLQTWPSDQGLGPVADFLRTASSADTASQEDHRFHLARAQSAMTHYTTRQEQVSPFATAIHLPSDKQKRIQALKELKLPILRAAAHFMAERSAFIDLSVSSTNETTFAAKQGDYCNVRFTVRPLEGVTSVRQVYDAFEVHLAMTDLLDHPSTPHTPTITETDGIMHHRCLHTVLKGIPLESNYVVFGKYYDTENTESDITAEEEWGDYGVFAFLAVDNDELYPYCPETRLREDRTSIIAIRSYKKRATAATTITTQNQAAESMGVVVIRQGYVKLHHTSLRIAATDLMELVRDPQEQRDEVQVTVITGILQSQQQP